MFILLATILIWRYLLLMPKFRCLEVCGTWPSKESFTGTSLSATSCSPTTMLSRWQRQRQRQRQWQRQRLLTNIEVAKVFLFSSPETGKPQLKIKQGGVKMSNHQPSWREVRFPNPLATGSSWQLGPWLVEEQLWKKQEFELGSGEPLFLPTSGHWRANLIFAFNQTATSPLQYLHQYSPFYPFLNALLQRTTYFTSVSCSAFLRRTKLKTIGTRKTWHIELFPRIVLFCSLIPWAWFSLRLILLTADKNLCDFP